jgi:hypothetical protein
MDKVPASPLLVRVLMSVAFTSRLKMLYIVEILNIPFLLNFLLPSFLKQNYGGWVRN